jgi:hypothetical protein
MAAKTKKASRIFSALDYKLMLYYCPGLSANEVYRRLCQRSEFFRSFLEELKDGNFMSVFLPDADERGGHLILEDNIDIGTLHHEAIHVTSHAFIMANSIHSEDTDELYAYHSEQFFNFILDTVFHRFELKLTNVAPL